MASSDAQHIGAWTFTSRGAPSEILKYSATHPAPPWPPSPAYFKAAGKGKPARAAEQEQWLLVRTSHAALNPGDRFTLRMLPRFMRAATQVPGTDLAGDVVDVWGSSEGAPGDAPAADGEPAQSAAVRRSRRPFRAGDRIIAFLPISFTYATGQGSLQTLVVIPARFAALNPAATASVLASPGGAQPSEDAIGAFAGLPLAGSVALALLDSARSGGSGGLGPGDRVLVNAAAGGIGTLTVQMVRRAVGRDGFVVGICSAASRDVVESLGVCDEVCSVLFYLFLSLASQSQDCRESSSHTLTLTL